MRDADLLRCETCPAFPAHDAPNCESAYHRGTNQNAYRGHREIPGMVSEATHVHGRRFLCALAISLSGTLFSNSAAPAQPARSSAANSPSLSSAQVQEPAAVAAWLKRLAGKYRFDGHLEVVFPGYGCAHPEPPPDVAYVPVPGADIPPPNPAVSYCRNISGKGDCVGIGKGPGIQCVLSVGWQDLYEQVTPSAELDDPRGGLYLLPGGVANLSPSVLLFGLDPGNAAINHLLVDQKGLPEGGLGFIAGNTATFKTTCVNAPTLLAGMKPPPRVRRPPEQNPQGPPPPIPNDRSIPNTCERTFRIEGKPDADILNMAIEYKINNDLWSRITMSMKREP